MIRIGLTGGIATGKTTVADMMVAQGAVLIDADVLAHQVVERGQPAYDDIVNTFGPGILDESLNLDRKKLGARVFGHAGELEKLNSLVHPRVRAAMKGLLDIYEQEENQLQQNFMVVLAVPLLFESNLSHLVDISLVVYCPAEQQLKRLMARNQLSEVEAWARIKSQLPIEEKAEIGDEVIDNSRDLDYTAQQLELFMRKWEWDRYEKTAA